MPPNDEASSVYERILSSDMGSPSTCRCAYSDISAVLAYSENFGALFPLQDYI